MVWCAQSFFFFPNIMYIHGFLDACIFIISMIGFSHTRPHFSVQAPVQERVHRSARVWNLYLDLEESMGTVETTKAAYDRALELKVASPQMVLNFAAFLEENKYFEDAFRVYEKVRGRFVQPPSCVVIEAYLSMMGTEWLRSCHTVMIDVNLEIKYDNSQ